jgi:CRP-like cAMP-binding protein
VLHLPAGEIIFVEGTNAAGLWVIGAGRVKIYKLSPEGDEHILHLLGPGDSFNDVSALDGGPTPANAAALTETTACVLSHESLMYAIEIDPVLAKTLIRFLTAHTRQLVQKVEDLALYSVTVRLARFLLKQPANPALHGPPITRVTIAAHLATQPETISRALGQLEKSGFIRMEGRQIVIENEELLRMVALL